jgi:hypothetical protein
MHNSVIITNYIAKIVGYSFVEEKSVEENTPFSPSLIYSF